jgi:protein arginine kinase activator
MTCEHCNSRPAEVVLTSIVDDEKTVRHVCRTCAAELGIEPDAESGTAEIVNLENKSAEDATEDALECPSCGLNWKQFKERYRVGCAVCYDAFRERMLPLLRKVHNSDSHSGKSISDAEVITAEDPVWVIDVLKRRMLGAVEREEFEEAARLRDQIDEAEQASKNERSGQNQT